MKVESNKNKSIPIDMLGICASVLCIIHCLAIPVLLIIGLESIVRSIDNHWVEVSILLLSLSIGLIAFFRGFMLHKQHFIPVLFIAGFLLIVNGESVQSEWLSILLAVSGASVISYAHIQNLKWRRNAIAA